MTVHQIYQAILSLPVPERLKLVERVVHDVAQTAGEGAPSASREPTPPPSLLGLFEDEPEIVDEVCAMALRDRAARRLRSDD